MTQEQGSLPESSDLPGTSATAGGPAPAAGPDAPSHLLVPLQAIRQQLAEFVACSADPALAVDAMEMLSHLVASAREAMIVVDEDFRIVLLNPSVERIFGYPAAQLIHQPLGMLLPAARRQAHEAHLRHFSVTGHTVRNMGQAMEVCGLRANGEEFPLDASIGTLRLQDRRLHSVMIEDLAERKRLQERVSQLTHRDPITDLPNRWHFLEQLRLDIDSARLAGQPLAVFVIDLDRFKVINDTLGHQLGDQILKQIAERLSGCCGPELVLARMGGDEFALIVPAVDSAERLAALAKNALAMIEAPLQAQGTELSLTASIGVSRYPIDGDDEHALLRHAEIAMYDTKGRGRNGVGFYVREANHNSPERLQLETALRRAIERGELELHFQPLLQLGSGHIIGVEALLRWHREGHGWIAPGVFIPLAEETGLIYPITDWVLERACQCAASWKGLGLHPLRIAVNLSALHLGQSRLVDDFGNILQRTGADARWLDIELTESAVMSNATQAIEILQALREMGVTVSVDDFGTGYSSLAYLGRLPLNALKIDMSFVRGLEGNASHRAIVKAIIGLAHNLDLSVVAEGIENRAQLAFLVTHQCDEGQGFLFSKPLPESDLLVLLRQTHAHLGLAPPG